MPCRSVPLWQARSWGSLGGVGLGSPPANRRVRCVVLNYNHLFYFHVAATEGSLAKAADRLGVTQPTVSEQIRQLERKLGVTLFQRSTAGLRLTERGRQAYQHTIPIFRETERLVSVLTGAPAETGRQLRVGVVSTVAHDLAPAMFLPLFAVPGCVATLHTGDISDLLPELLAHQLELVLCDVEPSADARQALTVVELHQPQLVAIAAPHLVLREGWGDTPVFQYSNGSAHRWEVETFLTSNRLRPRISGQTDDPALMLQAAIHGLAVAFVPRTLAREAIAADTVRVHATLEPKGAAVYALHHDSSVVNQAVARLAANARDLER